MSAAEDRAVNVLLEAIRQNTSVTIPIQIPIENVPANVLIFEKALRNHRVQEAARRAGGVKVELKLVATPLEQGKKMILDYARDQRDAHIVYPCLPADAADMRAALRLPEVQDFLRERNLTAEIRVQGGEKPQIVIAPLEAFTDGTFDEFERKHFK